MSSKTIPKDQLTAYQRWEMASFDAREEVKLPSVDEIARIHQQAYQEGFAIGMKEGRVEGQSVAQLMQRMMEELSLSLHNFEHNMAGEILDLALDIAQQMVRSTLHANPEMILPVVREVIETLPQVNQNAMLYLHPGDVERVRAMLKDEYHETHWRVVGDPHIEPGGCRVETSTSEVDATLEARWQRIVSALGSDVIWRK